MSGPRRVDAPARVGPYRVVGVLGEGGMGQVYLGRGRRGEQVALKVIRADLAGDREFRARFRQEIDAASRVRGPRTAAVLGADPDAECPWLATEYVPAPSLQQAVADHGPLPADAVRQLGIGLAEALLAVHGAGVVHRDLKPSNVLLAADGPRVIDFGIARAADATVLTRTGSVVGTPGYIAPEQVAHGTAGPAADVFALGGVLVHAATGRAPFGTGDPAVVLYRVLHTDPDLTGVPPRIAATVAACLRRDPTLRPDPHRVRTALAAGPAPDRPAPDRPGPDPSAPDPSGPDPSGRAAADPWLPAALVAPPAPPPPITPARRGRTAAVALALVVPAVVGLAALSSGRDTGGGTPVVTFTPTASSPPRPTTRAPTTSTTSTTPGPADEQVFAGPTAFTSPSGNIGCLVTADLARCDIVDSAWPDDIRPSRPPDCPLAFGDALQVSAGGLADFICHGDTTLSGGPTLEYGRSLRVGGTVCTSRESGVECRIDATRRGFTISRARYTVF